jgi:hypothetical protein
VEFKVSHSKVVVDEAQLRVKRWVRYKDLKE